MIKTLLADDHPVVVSGIQRYLAQMGDIEVCGVAASGPEVFERVAELLPEVLVLDINMPGMAGIKTVREIVDTHPKLAVLVFSHQPEDQFAVSILRAGARGFLNKTRHLSELVEAIRRVRAGGRYVTADLTNQLLEGKPSSSGSPHESLSPRERQVLERLAHGRTVHHVAVELAITVAAWRSTSPSAPPLCDDSPLTSTPASKKNAAASLASCTTRSSSSVPACAPR